jgi:hypothetical protein
MTATPGARRKLCTRSSRVPRLAPEPQPLLVATKRARRLNPHQPRRLLRKHRRRRRCLLRLRGSTGRHSGKPELAPPQAAKLPRPHCVRVGRARGGACLPQPLQAAAGRGLPTAPAVVDPLRSACWTSTWIDVVSQLRHRPLLLMRLRPPIKETGSNDCSSSSSSDQRRRWQKRRLRTGMWPSLMRRLALQPRPPAEGLSQVVTRPLVRSRNVRSAKNGWQ